MANPSASDSIFSDDQENEGMWISPLAAILAVPAEWGRGAAMPEAPRPGPKDMQVSRSLLRPPITSYDTPGAPRAAQSNSRRQPAPSTAPAPPLYAPSDGPSVVKAQLVACLLAEGPRKSSPPREKSWTKCIAITADRFGQEVVQKIADIKAAMDQAIKDQAKGTRGRALYVDEESELLLFLPDLNIPYIQIAEDYLTRRTSTSLTARYPIHYAKRRCAKAKETADSSINDKQ